MTVTPEIWEGDGFPEDADDAEILELFEDLGFIPDEILAVRDWCKREAWVYEHVAKRESGQQKEDTLIIVRHFWRRTERLGALAKAMDKQMDEEAEADEA